MSILFCKKVEKISWQTKVLFWGITDSEAFYSHRDHTPVNIVFIAPSPIIKSPIYKGLERCRGRRKNGVRVMEQLALFWCCQAFINMVNMPLCCIVANCNIQHKTATAFLVEFNKLCKGVLQFSFFGAIIVNERGAIQQTPKITRIAIQSFINTNKQNTKGR